jgi:hypothetical protein
MLQPHSAPAPQSFRRDGWTPRRQLAFLDTLARTRCVTRAAAAAGMSRESAYRLRRRPSAGLFAAAWDRMLEGHKGHAAAPAPGLAKRRETADSLRNPPKVTKWKDSPFEAILRELRDLDA